MDCLAMDHVRTFLQHADREWKPGEELCLSKAEAENVRDWIRAQDKRIADLTTAVMRRKDDAELVAEREKSKMWEESARHHASAAKDFEVMLNALGGKGAFWWASRADSAEKAMAQLHDARVSIAKRCNILMDDLTGMAYDCQTMMKSISRLHSRNQELNGGLVEAIEIATHFDEFIHQERGLRPFIRDQRLDALSRIAR